MNMRIFVHLFLVFAILKVSRANKVCESKCIVFAKSGELRALQLGGLRNNLITKMEGAVISLDADSKKNSLYLSHYTSGYLQTCLVNNYQGTTNVAKDHGTDIAVEPLNGFLYWTDFMGKSIGRASLDGSQEVETLLTGDNIRCPLGIAVDGKERSLFWTDPCLSLIQKSDLDGKNIVQIISGPSKTKPVSLALDQRNKLVYWGDRSGSINCMDYNGEQLKVIFTKAKMYPISLTFDHGTVYFADRQHKVIAMVNVKTSEYKTLLEETAYAIAIFLPPIPRDGGWGNWECWTPCSVSCGSGGTQTRRRKCNHPHPALGGDPCVGSDTIARECAVEVACEHPSGETFVKVGCFDNGNHIFTLKFTDRQAQKPHDQPDCFSVDWNHYQAYLTDFIHRCASAARDSGQTYFAVQYYGECWIGNDYSKYNHADKCTDQHYSEACNEASDVLCIGVSLTNYIYMLT